MDARDHERPLRHEPALRADRPGPLPPRKPAHGAIAPDRAVAVLEGIGEAIVALDRDMRVTWWNTAAERGTGIRREEIVGQRVFERFRQLAGTAAERVVQDAISRRQPRKFPGWRYRGAADGAGAGVYDARLWPLEDGGLLLLFAEVTARDEQREQLETRVRENEELRDYARAMAGVADSSELLRLLCRAAVERLGGISSVVVRERGDGTGECIAAWGAGRPLEGSTFPLAGSVIERVIQTGRSVVLDRYASESPYFRDVARREGMGPLVMTPLVAHNDEFLGVFGVARQEGAPPFSSEDLERLGVYIDHASLAAWKARLIERANEANEIKTNFLASMSHELRTPLTALTGYGELLADEILGPLAKPQLEVVERMRSVTHHLSALIDELLTYSSLEAGREHARLAMAQPAEIVEEALVVVEPLARQKGLDFSAAPAGMLPLIRTDADKVRQILVNLLGNAIKFTPSAGRVALDYTCTDHELRFAVADSGIGIAPDDQKRLFQPFAQLDGGLTRRHGGTGLGLYISRKLAEMLGGRIELESALGAGARFTLVLPR